MGAPLGCLHMDQCGRPWLLLGLQGLGPGPLPLPTSQNMELAASAQSAPAAPSELDSLREKASSVERLEMEMEGSFQGKQKQPRKMGVSGRGGWAMGLSHLQSRSSHARYAKVGHNFPFPGREGAAGEKD